jgi:diketogulonate reductase-like aldo/keto reductase
VGAETVGQLVASHPTMALDIRSTLSLNNGVAMPRLGLGVWQTARGSVTREAVAAALAAGYRAIDTARIYGNEAEVGEALRGSGLPRAEWFITTKLWNDDQGYDRALRAFDASAKKLGLEQIDLYLIHWPVSEARRESWRALEKLYADKRVRAIGVSNYTVAHLERLLGECSVRPAVNQVELHPFLAQRALRDFCKREKIAVEAYSPLTRGERLADPRIAAVAKKHGRSPAQILIRWALESDLLVIPKSATPARIRENGGVFDFALDEGDRAALDGLDEEARTCWDPSKVP